MKKNRRNRRNGIAVLGILTLIVAIFTGCGKGSDKKEADTGKKEAETKTIRVGASITPHSEILKEAKKILEKEGINLEVVEIEDVVTPNTGVLEGTLDANFFQHQPYLDDFNKENNSDLVSIGTVHYEPFGVYSKKIKSIDELEKDAKVAVPNNVTNEARALLLLEQEGVIKLKEGAGILASTKDIVENPLNIQFVEIDPSQLVNALPDVSIAVINGNYAIEGGLSVKEAIAVEADSSVAAQTYANILVTLDKNKDNEALKRLAEVLQSDEIQNFIKDKYDGSVVPIKVK